MMDPQQDAHVCESAPLSRDGEQRAGYAWGIAGSAGREVKLRVRAGAPVGGNADGHGLEGIPGPARGGLSTPP